MTVPHLTSLARSILASAKNAAAAAEVESDTAAAASTTTSLSELEFALNFLPQPGVDAKIVGKAGNDRLVKTARMILSLLDDKRVDDTDNGNDTTTCSSEAVIERSLERLVQDFTLVATPSAIGHVPRVTFGKTGLQMPIATLGCMRCQQAWGNKIQNMNQVDTECQDNLLDILRTAILQYGMVHIETARGYGCSELQLGVALQQLMLSGQVKREDLIIQTKVNANQDPNVFRQELETSMKLLKVDYVDLFAIHGFNLPEHFE